MDLQLQLFIVLLWLWLVTISGLIAVTETVVLTQRCYSKFL